MLEKSNLKNKKVVSRIKDTFKGPPHPVVTEPAILRKLAAPEYKPLDYIDISAKSDTLLNEDYETLSQWREMPFHEGYYVG